MRTTGYIKLPRSIQAESWYCKPACRLVALHLLLECSYRTSEGVEAGVLTTSVRSLANEIGISYQECRTAISTLEASGFLAVQAVQGKGVALQLSWQDFISLRDGNIMLNNAPTNALTNALDTLASGIISSGCEDEKKLLTHSLTHSLTHINKEILSNTHTGYNYPGKILKAGAREAHAYTREVRELEQWMAQYTPDFLAMEIPLSPQRMAEMIATYPMADIQRLLATAWSKGACSRHRSAWQAFKSYARNDRELKATSGEKLYTYAEVCDYVAKFNIRQEDAFEIVPAPAGEKPKWRRIA